MRTRSRALAELTPEREVLRLLARGLSKSGDRGRARRERAHGEDARHAHPLQARPSRPHPGRRPRLRERPRAAWRESARRLRRASRRFGSSAALASTGARTGRCRRREADASAIVRQLCASDACNQLDLHRRPWTLRGWSAHRPSGRDRQLRLLAEAAAPCPGTSGGAAGVRLTVRPDARPHLPG